MHVRDLRPVEGDERHGEASLRAEELVNDLVVRGNPRNPGEVREGSEEVAGNEVPAEVAAEYVEEEALAIYTTAIADAGILLGVEGVEEGAKD